MKNRLRRSIQAQRNSPVARENAMSLPLTVIIPSLRKHFHFDFDRETFSNCPNKICALSRLESISQVRLPVTVNSRLPSGSPSLSELRCDSAGWSRSNFCCVCILESRTSFDRWLHESPHSCPPCDVCFVCFRPDTPQRAAAHAHVSSIMDRV